MTVTETHTHPPMRAHAHTQTHTPLVMTQPPEDHSRLITSTLCRHIFKLWSADVV